MHDDHHGGNVRCIEIGCGVILIELWGEKGCESVTEWVLFFTWSLRVIYEGWDGGSLVGCQLYLNELFKKMGKIDRCFGWQLENCMGV